jgi:hypothetical protein
LICNDDVRRTVDGFIGVNNSSERLTIVERLLKKIMKVKWCFIIQ